MLRGLVPKEFAAKMATVQTQMSMHKCSTGGRDKSTSTMSTSTVTMQANEREHQPINRNSKDEIMIVLAR